MTGYIQRTPLIEHTFVESSSLLLVDNKISSASKGAGFQLVFSLMFHPGEEGKTSNFVIILQICEDRITYIYICIYTYLLQSKGFLPKKWELPKNVGLVAFIGPCPQGWLPSNTALHGGKAVPAKPTLKMDRGELGAEAWWKWIPMSRQYKGLKVE